MKNGFWKQMTSKHLSLTLATVAALALFGAGNVASAQSKELGKFNKWSAHSYEEDGSRVCNMFSSPTKHEEGGRKRGNIFAFVTHRPKSKRYHEVSFGMGYPLKKDAPVKVSIGGKNFQLFSHGSVAFAYDKDDKAIVKAMRRGNTMTVQGVSARGTKTRDTYSLKGFTKANNAINGHCSVRKP